MYNRSWKRPGDLNRRPFQPGDYPVRQWTYTAAWYAVPGPYSGIGPRNYQRQDQLITADINDRLLQHGQLDASNISVGVSQGNVTLNGSVHSRQEKRLAEDIAASVFGAGDIQNNLHIQPPGPITGRGMQQDRQTANRSYSPAGSGAQVFPEPGRKPSGQPSGAHPAWQQGHPQHWSESYTNVEGQPTGAAQAAAGAEAGAEAKAAAQPCGDIRPGMPVVGKGGKPIGSVKEIRQHDFLVNRPLARDVYVPFDACQQVDGHIVLKFSSDDIDKQDWPKPGLL